MAFAKVRQVSEIKRNRPPRYICLEESSSKLDTLPNHHRRLWRLVIISIGCCCLVLFFTATKFRTDPDTVASTSLNNYRLSDGILRQYDAPGCELFPNSLVCMYHHEANDSEELNMVALLRVIERNEQRMVKTVHEHTAFVHVRLGDGLCAQYDIQCRGERVDVPSCWESDYDCWRDANSVTKQYCYSKHWYDDVFDQLANLRVQRIEIIGDMHHWTRTSPDPRKGDFTIDKAYVTDLANALRMRHFDVFVRDPRTPDEDFLYMCSAEVFVQGGGGYSALIASVVEARGGNVLRPSRRT